MGKSVMDDMQTFFTKKGYEEGIITVDIRENSGVDEDVRVANLRLFYNKLEELGYSLGELKEVLESEGTMLILAGAGTGKTTALILKIIRDMIAGELLVKKEINGVDVVVPAKILVSTFLRSGAEELKKAFGDWCRLLGVTGLDSSYIEFKTIHAEVLGVVKHMGVAVNLAEQIDPMVRQAIKAHGIHSVMGNGKSATIDEVSDIKCLISYARNRLDAQKYNHALMGEYTMDNAQMDAMLETFRMLKRAIGVMDFEDTQEMLLEGLQKNPNVREVVATRYDYIYLDEFQDTSQLQYEILKYYFKGAKKVLCIGDDDQTIYSWRGSDLQIIKKMYIEDFNPGIKQLNTNYRCSANILDAVIPSIEKNTERHKKSLKAFKQGGELNVVLDGDVNMLMESIQKDKAAGYTVGVIARTNADLLIPAVLLELDDTIGDFALSKSVSLDMRMPKQVFGFIDLITKRYTPEFESMLKMFVPRFKHYEVEKLCETLRVNKDKSLYNIPLKDLSYSVPTLYPLLEKLRANKKVDNRQTYLVLLEEAREQVYKGKTIYAKKARDFIDYVKAVVENHHLVKEMELDELDDLFKVVLPRRMGRRKNKKQEDMRIKLTTVHEAKGKEWDSVYIWNNVEGSFPNAVGNRELTAEEHEEERRVHYIAWTRAKKKLTVFTQRERQGSFLKECALAGADILEMGVPIKDIGKMTVFKKKADVGITVETELEKYYDKYNSLNFIGTKESIALDLCDMQKGREVIKARLEEIGIMSVDVAERERVITETVKDILEGK